MCLETFSVETYLRRMRRTFRTLGGKLDCKDAKGRPYKRNLLRIGHQKRDRKIDTLRPRTWRTLHRAVSGGKLCSGVSDTWLETNIGFGRRAVSVKLKPDQKVTRDMLGEPLSPERLIEIVAEMDEIFCPTIEGWKHKQEHGVCLG